MALRTVEGSFAVRAMGKAQPLGTMPLSRRRPRIRVALESFARGDAFEEWTTKVQTAELANADLPRRRTSGARPR